MIVNSIIRFKITRAYPNSCVPQTHTQIKWENLLCIHEIDSVVQSKKISTRTSFSLSFSPLMSIESESCGIPVGFFRQNNLVWFIKLKIVKEKYFFLVKFCIPSRECFFGLNHPISFQCHRAIINSPWFYFLLAWNENCRIWWAIFRCCFPSLFF